MRERGLLFNTFLRGALWKLYLRSVDLSFKRQALWPSCTLCFRALRTHSPTILLYVLLLLVEEVTNTNKSALLPLLTLDLVGRTKRSIFSGEILFLTLRYIEATMVLHIRASRP